MRFQREKPPDTATATGRLVQIPRIAVGLNADVAKIEIGQNLATAINEGRISGPVHGSRSVRSVQRIGNLLAALPYRYGPPQLDSQAAGRQNITWQWVIRYFIEPPRRALRVGAKRQQHIARHDRHIVIQQIVYSGETEI